MNLFLNIVGFPVRLLWALICILIAVLVGMLSSDFGFDETDWVKLGKWVLYRERGAFS